MRLSAHDASFLYTETASGPMHGIGITQLSGPATYQEILDYYAERIHLVPRLRQKIAFVPFNLAHPKWVDDPDFDLRNHVVAHPVPANTKLKRAREIALELGEPLLDRSRPLWLTYVIENVQGKTLLIQLSHHAFVDGATAVAMSTVLTDPTPDAEPPEPGPAWRPAPLPSSFELWQEAVTENARTGMEQASSLFSNATSMAELAEKGTSLVERMSRPVMQAPWNASLVGPKRSFTTLEYKLADFKPLRAALGGTLNDLVVTAVMEGAARYLVQKGEAVKDQMLRLMCPVDVRTAEDDPLGGGGNRVSAMFPVLSAEPLGALPRLAEVTTELNEIKKNEEPWVMDQYQHLQPNVPPVAMAQSLSVGTQWDPTAAAARAPLPVLPNTNIPRAPLVGFNFTCTNVPGPNWTQYVAGYQVESAVGTLMLGGNLGFGASVGSYDGNFIFGFTADPRLMPDVERFADYVAGVIVELQDAVGEKTNDTETEAPQKAQASAKSAKRSKKNK